MELSFQTLAVLVVGCLDLIVGSVIISQNPRNPINISFAFFAASGALWAGSLGFFLSLTNVEWLDFFARMLYWGGVSIPVAFYYFAVVFKTSRFPDKRKALLILLPLFLLFLLYFFTDLLIVHYIIFPTGVRGFVYGDLHYLFDITLWVYFGLALSEFAHTYRRVDEHKRPQVLLILIGTYSVLAVAALTNIITPSFFKIFQYIWIGPLAMVVWVSCVAYAVARYQLFSVKLIATELLVVALWLFLLFRVFISQNSQDFWINGISFITVLVLGLLIIRSALKEIDQREKIEQLSNEKSEFMSFASHEIRNPITAMRGYASLIVDGTVEDGQAKSVAQKILVNGDTVLSLISEFLNKSKLELGQISYSVADVDIDKTVRSIAEGFKAHAREKGLSLDLKIDFAALTAKADEAKLREVVGNLIDNSVKYTQAGGVTVTVEKRNGMARIVVSDTGVGIPPETISHLFQKFSRADAAKMNLLGTGLGLYLAKTFVEGMGGKIWAESDGPGKGSRFIIELHTV